MLREIHIWIWGLVSDFEHFIYPWKVSTPPDWAIERYCLDHNVVDPYDQDRIYNDWIKSHDEKISRLQEEMIQVQKTLKELKK